MTLTRRDFANLMAGITATSMFGGRPSHVNAAQKAHTPEPISRTPVTIECSTIEQSISRMYSASGLPPIPPSEYRELFSTIALQSRRHGMSPAQTTLAVSSLLRRRNIMISKADIRFVVNTLYRQRNSVKALRTPRALARACQHFVLAKCRHANVNLTNLDRHILRTWLPANA